MTGNYTSFAICVIALSLPHIGAAQYYRYNDQYDDHEVLFEAGIGVGLIAGLTDIGGNAGSGGRFLKDLNWSTMRPVGNLFTKANYHNWLAVSFEFSAGTVTGADSLLGNVAPSTHGRYERNLSFRTRIKEAVLQFEVHPLRAMPSMRSSTLSPYLHFGGGLYHFNPQAMLDNKWHDLAPLSTEGQGLPAYPGRRPYKLLQLNVPVGIGLRYELGAKANLYLDITHRFLFTDYLDDVSTTYPIADSWISAQPTADAILAAQLSDRRLRNHGTAGQRGNPQNRDSYFTVELRCAIVLNRERIF